MFQVLVIFRLPVWGVSLSNLADVKAVSQSSSLKYLTELTIALSLSTVTETLTYITSGEHV